MSEDFSAFHDSLRRCLDGAWPMRLTPEFNRSTGKRREIWAALTDLGISQLGRQPVSGIVAALPVIREVGARNCAAPVAEAIVLNALLGEGAPGWLDEMHRGCVMPALSVVERNVSTVYDNGTLSGTAHAIDITAATHVAITARSRIGAPFLGWLSLDQARPLISATAQDIYLEVLRANVQFDNAVCDGLPISEQCAADMSLLWRYLAAVRATGALLRAFDGVIEHVKQRRQFGVPIGSFQAMQHKLTNIHIVIDGALLTQDAAAEAFDRGSDTWRVKADIAIAAADPALRRSMLEVLHAYGAIGYSEEHEAPRHWRRVHVDSTAADGNLSRKRLYEAVHSFPEPLLMPDLGAAAESSRQEVRTWLQTHWTDADAAAEAKRPLNDRGFNREFSRKLGREGWISMTWPLAYGGQERSRLDQLVFVQETTRAKAPTSAHAGSATIIAPSIMQFGTGAQKAEFLPRIARGDLTICLGYSESEAGSDLASLRTSAIRDGDQYVINGEKLWCTLADKADYVWLAARTGDVSSKHRGISIFIIPMNTPGIAVRPSFALYGHTFSSVTFDHVRVPETALVGEINMGWSVILGALADERIHMGSYVAEIGMALSKLTALMGERDVVSDLDKDRIGALVADVGVANALLLRSVKSIQAGATSPVEAAITKVYSSELMERLGEAAVDILGIEATVSGGTSDAAGDGELEQLLRKAPMLVIGGGANEIQRTLIAQRGLGLPR